jgi:hypothetical protein
MGSKTAKNVAVIKANSPNTFGGSILAKTTLMARPPKDCK